MKPYQKWLIGLAVLFFIVFIAGAGIYLIRGEKLEGHRLLSGRTEENQELMQYRSTEEDSEDTAEMESDPQSMTEDETEETQAAAGAVMEDGTEETQAAAGAVTEDGTESMMETASETGTEEESERETAEIFQNGYTVGIDPGHQGSWVNMSEQEPDGPGSSNYKAKASTGTEGRYTGVPEYQLNLDISLALRTELEKRGYRVVMTREDNDTAISNSERALLAAEKGSDIYVRIHANGSDDSSVSGALAMSPSPDNPYIASLYEDSFRLAKCILEQYCQATGFSNLGVQYYDNMSGINWSQVPVMILEMGFMTNEGEDYAMQDADMQKQMVKGIADGIDDYFGLDHMEYLKFEAGKKSGQEAGAEENEAESVGETDMRESEAELSGISAEGPIPEIESRYLKQREANGEKWAVSVELLNASGTKEIYEHQGSDRMQSASVIKVFIMGAVYDRMCYPSSPDRLIQANEAYDGELRALLEQMITVSDNDAANELITRLGSGDFQAGAEVVNEFCRENGYVSTSVGRRFMEENPAGDNYTSAADCRKILSDIYHGTCVEAAASQKMLDILKQQTNTSKIPSGIPAAFSSANKTGEMPDGYGLGCIENDMAVLFTENGDYILTVLSNELNGRNEEAKQTIRDISLLVWNWFGENEQQSQNLEETVGNIG